MTQPGPIHLVFVHGLFSSPRVWDKFRELIASDPELDSFILAEPFKYPSPKFVLRLDRRIAKIDDLADLLGTYLSTHFDQGERVVLISHSLGGLSGSYGRSPVRSWKHGTPSCAPSSMPMARATPNAGSPLPPYAV
jgi:pimeloyl-ACP methyl ester carboxylesterase